MFSTVMNFIDLAPWTRSTASVLSFQTLTQNERTKHIHKIHPYKGKFIPQLAETIIKKNFKKGSFVLDPFVGSGTTLVQSNELGINSIGIDISEFNCMLTKAKTNNYNLKTLHSDAERLLASLHSNEPPKTPCNRYLKTWFMPLPRSQLTLLQNNLLQIRSKKNKDLLTIVVSRTAKSVIATKHRDISTLKKPIKQKYYCEKHKKTCSPVIDIKPKFRSYLIDTLSRVEEYKKVSTSAFTKSVACDIKTAQLKKILKGKLLDGVLTSPPYVGQIDYHKQFEYAFELFNLSRNDQNEIGPLFRGRRIGAQKRYVLEMVAALKNIKPHLKPNAKVIIVANDRFNLYPNIAKESNFKITKRVNRSVHRRNEGDQTPYQETIFTLIAL